LEIFLENRIFQIARDAQTADVKQSGTVLFCLTRCAVSRNCQTVGDGSVLFDESLAKTIKQNRTVPDCLTLKKSINYLVVWGKSTIFAP